MTSHVEDIAQALQAMGRNAVVLGESLLPGVPTIQRVDALALLNEGSPVTWHAHRPHSLKEGLKLRKKWPHLRVIWTHHNWKAPSWPTRRLLQKADAVISLTQEGADQLDMESTVIGHGVDLNRFQPVSKTPTFRVGIIGRIRPDKGHDTVVKAFNALGNEREDWGLSFFGEVRPQHRGFAKKLHAQCPDKMSICSFSTDRVEMYRQLDVVVMASPAEGYSLVIPEALAMGLPVLSTPLPHFERLLKHGENILFFSPGTPDSLAQELEALLGEESARHTLGQHARQAAETHFSIEKEGRLLCEVYDRELSNR